MDPCELRDLNRDIMHPLIFNRESESALWLTIKPRYTSDLLSPKSSWFQCHSLVNCVHDFGFVFKISQQQLVPGGSGKAREYRPETCLLASPLPVISAVAMSEQTYPSLFMSSYPSLYPALP